MLILDDAGHSLARGTLKSVADTEKKRERTNDWLLAAVFSLAYGVHILASTERVLIQRVNKHKTFTCICKSDSRLPALAQVYSSTPTSQAIQTPQETLYAKPNRHVNIQNTQIFKRNQFAVNP